MKFLLLTQYYLPESGSASIKMSELAEYLTNKGHHVSVITGFPNYPHGKIYDGYKMKLYYKEKINGVNVIRVPLYITDKRYSFKFRMINHTSFMITSIYGSLIAGKHDLVYYYSPPLFLGLSAWLIGRIYRVPVVGEFNDLWPQAPIQMGIIKNNMIKKIAFKFERFVYHKTDFLFFYSETHRSAVISEGIKERKTEIHPLWISTDEFKPVSKELVNNLRRSFGWENKFIVMYAGYIGKAQGLDILIGVAKRLRNEKKILFILVGDGPEKENLLKKTQELNLENVKFIPFQTKEKIPIFLSAADVLFASLKPAPHRLGTIPAKVLAYMSMGKPLLCVAQGETANLIKKSGSGININEEDENKLSEAILKIYKDKELAAKMGVNGRKYATEYFDKEKVLSKIERRLIEIAKGN